MGLLRHKISQEWKKWRKINTHTQKKETRQTAEKLRGVERAANWSSAKQGKGGKGRKKWNKNKGNRNKRNNTQWHNNRGTAGCDRLPEDNKITE